MIWYDMSYNQLNIDFLHKMETEPEEIEYEVEDIVNEFNQTDTFVFNSNRCFL